MASIFACNELCAAAQPDIAKAGETLITFSKQLLKYNISIHMRLAHLPITITSGTVTYLIPYSAYVNL